MSEIITIGMIQTAIATIVGFGIDTCVCRYNEVS